MKEAQTAKMAETVKTGKTPRMAKTAKTGLGKANSDNPLALLKNKGQGRARSGFWAAALIGDEVVVVVVVGAAYRTILFSVTINIYISITINYRDTIHHGESSFLSFSLCGEHFSSGLRRRSDIHDLPYA